MKKKLLRPIAICLGFFVGRKALRLFEFVKEWRLGLRRVRDFFGVSSLSHGFARALPYSAMERRIEIF